MGKINCITDSNCKRCFSRESEKASEMLLSGSQELNPTVENSNQTINIIPEDKQKGLVKETLQIKDSFNNKDRIINNQTQNIQNTNNMDNNNDKLNEDKEENNEDINYNNLDDDSSFLMDDKIQSRKNVLQTYQKLNSNSTKELIYKNQKKNFKHFNQDKEQNNFKEEEEIEINYEEEDQDEGNDEEYNDENGKTKKKFNGEKLYDEGEGYSHEVGIDEQNEEVEEAGNYNSENFGEKENGIYQEDENEEYEKNDDNLKNGK